MKIETNEQDNSAHLGSQMDGISRGVDKGAIHDPQRALSSTSITKSLQVQGILLNPKESVAQRLPMNFHGSFNIKDPRTRRLSINNADDSEIYQSGAPGEGAASPGAALNSILENGSDISRPKG